MNEPDDMEQLFLDMCMHVIRRNVWNSSPHEHCPWMDELQTGFEPVDLPEGGEG